MAKPSQENFYKRLNELAGNKSKVNETIIGIGTLIDFQKSDEGTIYGIVKENHRYFIKKSNSQNNQLDSSDFAYIGGLENKHLHEHHSVGEAKKHRNMYIKSLNEAFSLKPNAVLKEVKKEKKIENPFDFLRNQINEGKTGNKKKFEANFKSSLTTNIVESTNKKGLMPDAADLAVKKALGLINEEESPLVTADSEVEGQDVLPNQNDHKEDAQAPINDTNAKTIADGNTGHNGGGNTSLPNQTEASPESDPFDDKEDAGDETSDIVSEPNITEGTTKKNINEEESPLVTADSEVEGQDVLPNQRDQKEPAQAPINDTNAKTIADGNTGHPAAQGTSLPNQTEASPESDPFDDKEDAGDETSDIVSEAMNWVENSINEEALTTADSEVKAGDVLPNMVNKKHEPAQAPINDTNAKKIADGNTGKQGSASLANNVEASPESDPFTKKQDAGDEKGDIVSEKNITESEKKNGALTTADSEVEGQDVLPNQRDKKESSQADVNDENAKTKADSNTGHNGGGSTSLPNQTETSEESDPFVDKEDAGDETSDIVSEVAAFINNLITEDIEDELAAQSGAVDALDDMTSAEEVPADPMAEPEPEVAPEMGAEPEMGGEMEADPMAEPDMGGEMEADPMAEPEMGAEPDMGDEMGGEDGKQPADEETKSEVESILGQLGELVRDKGFSTDEIVQYVNTAVEPFDTETLSHNEQLKIQNKLNGEEGDGEDLPPEAPVDGEELPGTDAGMPDLGPESGMEDVEEADVEVGGEVGGEEGCAECGPFDGYAASRGYDDVSSAGGMELGNLLSGYAGAHGEGQNDGDFGKIIILLTPEIRDELMGYGHEDYLGKADAFAQENPVADEERLSPGSFDIEVPTDDISGGEEEGLESAEAEVDAEAEVSTDDGTAEVEVDAEENVEENINEVENLEELNWGDVKNFGAGVAGLGKDAGKAVGQKVGQAQQAVGGAMQKGVDAVKGAGQAVGQKVGQAATQVKQGYNKHAGNQQINAIQQKAQQLGGEISKFNNFATKAGQQPIPIQSIIMQINSQLKGGAENIDLQSRRMEGNEVGEPQQAVGFGRDSQNLGVATRMGEGEAKIRNYVKNRLQELAGKKKPTITEAQKPESLKKLDKMIEEQWKTNQVK